VKIIFVISRHKEEKGIFLPKHGPYKKTAGNVRFEVFRAVTMKNGIFWDVTPCGSCKN
jgi:hypothetical protein